MNMRHLVIITFSLLLLFSAAGTAAAQGPTDDFMVVQAAADKYLSSGKSPTITADALWENLNDGDTSNDPFIVSVRKPEDYAKGHIPGAINIFWKDITKPENLAKLPTNRQIVVYCYSGHTGQIATTVLNLLGYDAVNLKYGMMGWTLNDAVLAQPRFGPTTDQRDYRVEQEPHTAAGTYAYPALDLGVQGNEFEIIRAAAERWITTAKTPVIAADAVWENLNDGDSANDPFILSVRKPEDYAKGHLPGAVNILWKDVAKMENLAKLPPDKPIVAYCYTGHTGEVATTVLGVLGYDVSNLKYGMMGWTLDDAVLATARFGPNTDQRDYRIETAAAPAAEQAAPAQLPSTGGPASPTWLIWLTLGLTLLLGGLIVRRRFVN